MDTVNAEQYVFIRVFKLLYNLSLSLSRPKTNVELWIEMKMNTVNAEQ